MRAARPVSRFALGAIVFLAGALAVMAAGEDPLAKHFGGSFTLQSHEGKSVSDTDFRGRFMLIYFGYTHCPDICPTGLARLTQALEQIGPSAQNIQPLFITVDPARDTAAHLAGYRESFHPQLIMLTGSEKQIAAVTKAYRVHRRKYLWNKDAGADSNDYGVDHGSLVYLMGPDGAFRTFLPHGTPADKMAATLKRYVDNE